MKFQNVTLIGLFLVVLNVQAGWAIHPAEGKQLPKGAGNVMSERSGVPASWSINDLTFPLVGEYPTAEELTYLEVYMVVGVNWEKDGKTWGMSPWSSEIAHVVHRFYDQYGYVPGVLDAELILQTPGYENKTDQELEVYKNPLTGAWPRLDAMYHSPGDMYIRPLTADEKHHFASVHQPFQERWFDGLSYSNRAGGYVNIEMLNEPFYLRAYGYDETLVARIDYMWREDN